MVVIDPSIEINKRKRIRIIFFTIAFLFLIAEIVLDITNIMDMFWAKLCIFAACTFALLGLEYIILCHVKYITWGKTRKTEKLITFLFYTGIISIILYFIFPKIVNPEDYLEISPFNDICEAIELVLGIGVFLFELSIILTVLKFRKIINLFR